MTTTRRHKITKQRHIKTKRSIGVIVIGYIPLVTKIYTDTSLIA